MSGPVRREPLTWRGAQTSLYADRRAAVASGMAGLGVRVRMIDQLEDNDDVQDVYANCDISEEASEAVAG